MNIENFVSNDYDAPDITEQLGLLLANKPEGENRADLRTLPHNAVLYVSGIHPSAIYILKIEETATNKYVHIWRDPDANGFVTTLENIV